FWLSVGGDRTLDSYRSDIPVEHVAFIAGLPLMHETEEYIFVHAGLNWRGGTSREEMLWGAAGFWGDVDPLTGRLLKGGLRSFPKTIVVGHKHFEQPMVGTDIIGIDTGCGVGGPLTAVQLPEMDFFSEPDAGSM